MNEAVPTPSPPDPGDEDAPAVPFRQVPPAFIAPAARLLSSDSAAAYCGMSRRTWFELDQRGVIPSPIRLSNRIVLWDRESLDHWIDLGCPGRARFEEIRAARQHHPNGRRLRPSAS